MPAQLVGQAAPCASSKHSTAFIHNLASFCPTRSASAAVLASEKWTLVSRGGQGVGLRGGRRDKREAQQDQTHPMPERHVNGWQNMTGQAKKCCAGGPLTRLLRRQGAPRRASSCATVAPARVALIVHTILLRATARHIFRTDGQLLTAGWPASRQFLRPLATNLVVRVWPWLYSSFQQPKARSPCLRLTCPLTPGKGIFLHIHGQCQRDDQISSLVKPVCTRVQISTSLTSAVQTSTTTLLAHQPARWLAHETPYSPRSPSSSTSSPSSSSAS